MKKIELEFDILQDFSAFQLDDRFQAFDLRTYLGLGDQILSRLPSGPSIKYLRIQQQFHFRKPFTLENIILLRIKFPKL